MIQKFMKEISMSEDRAEVYLAYDLLDCVGAAYLVRMDQFAELNTVGRLRVRDLVYLVYAVDA